MLCVLLFAFTLWQFKSSMQNVKRYDFYNVGECEGIIKSSSGEKPKGY